MAQIYFIIVTIQRQVMSVFVLKISNYLQL